MLVNSRGNGKRRFELRDSLTMFQKGLVLL